jgi:ribonuclease HI
VISREEHNPYTAELAAIARALEDVPASIYHRNITIFTRSQSALEAIRRPRQQSGQGIIRQIYKLARLHNKEGTQSTSWIPAEANFALGAEAKVAA